MVVKATVSFGGTISMRAGEVREIEPGATLADLLRVGYVVGVEEAEPKKKSNTKKGVKAVEN